MKVGMTSGKLLCIVGTLFLLTFKRIVVEDNNYSQTLNTPFSVLVNITIIYLNIILDY